MKHNACSRETIEALLKTTSIKRHLAEIQRQLNRLGFDARTREQKEEEEKQKAQYRRWALNDLMKRYPREKIYEELWAEPMIKVAKRLQRFRCSIGESLSETQYSATSSWILGKESRREACVDASGVTGFELKRGPHRTTDFCVATQRLKVGRLELAARAKGRSSDMVLLRTL